MNMCYVNGDLINPLWIKAKDLPPSFSLFCKVV